MKSQICTSDDVCRFGRVSELFVYEKFNRVPADSVEAGDICAVCGIDDIQVSKMIYTNDAFAIDVCFRINRFLHRLFFVISLHWPDLSVI